MQGNLLRVQLQKKSLMDCDTSSAASTTNEVPFSPTIHGGGGQSGSKTTVSELQAQKHPSSSRHQPSSSGDTTKCILVICNLSSFCSNFHILNNLLLLGLGCLHPFQIIFSSFSRLLTLKSFQNYSDETEVGLAIETKAQLSRFKPGWFKQHWQHSTKT